MHLAPTAHAYSPPFVSFILTVIDLGKSLKKVSFMTE